MDPPPFQAARGWGAERRGFRSLWQAASHGLYSDFFAALAGVARAFKKPVLFLHGQFHAWEVQRGFLAKNITRVMAAGGSAPPQRVIVTLDANTPFRFPGRDAPGDSALAGEG